MILIWIHLGQFSNKRRIKETAWWWSKHGSKHVADAKRKPLLVQGYWIGFVWKICVLTAKKTTTQNTEQDADNEDTELRQLFLLSFFPSRDAPVIETTSPVSGLLSLRMDEKATTSCNHTSHATKPVSPPWLKSVLLECLHTGLEIELGMLDFVRQGLDDCWSLLSSRRMRGVADNLGAEEFGV
jgi:hypothetical protein